MPIKSTILFVLLAIIASTAHADGWARPSTKRVTSPNKLWEFTAEPPKSSPLSGKSTGSLISTKDKTIVWMAPLVCVPAFIDVHTVDGKPYVVTRDRWYRVGYDHCLVIYGPDGKVVKDFKLEDLLTGQEILRHVTQSVSSRWWNEVTKYEIVESGMDSRGAKRWWWICGRGRWNGSRSCGSIPGGTPRRHRFLGLTSAEKDILE